MPRPIGQIFFNQRFFFTRSNTQNTRRQKNTRTNLRLFLYGLTSCWLTFFACASLWYCYLIFVMYTKTFSDKSNTLVQYFLHLHIRTAHRSFSFFSLRSFLCRVYCVYLQVNGKVSVKFIGNASSCSDFHRSLFCLAHPSPSHNYQSSDRCFVRFLISSFPFWPPLL